MIKKLRQIEINFKYGYHANKSADGDIKYLSAKHFDDDYRLTDDFDDSFIDRPEKKVLDKFLLKPNDVIITGKGFRIFAWSYDSIYGDCIPSTLFYKFTLDPTLILSKFFEIQFNYILKDKYLGSSMVGSTIPILKKKDLLDIPVKIPSISKQEEVIKLWHLMNIERLTQQLILEKSKLRNKIQFKKIYKGL